MKKLDKKLRELFDDNVNRIILLMFLCIMVYNFGHPATPGLIELRGWQRSISGVLLAIMSTAMFMASPYLGALGDKIGMKKIFVFMPVLYGTAQLLFGFSPYISLVFLARALGGFGSGGTHAMIFGYMGHISKKEDKTKNIAKVSSAGIFGGALGQKIGGLLATIDTRYPFALQFLCGIIISLIALKIMREIEIDKKENNLKKGLNPLLSFTYIKELDNYSKYFCFIIFLSCIGGYTYSSSINYFLKFNIKVSSDVIGTYVMFSSLVAFLGTSVILGKLLKKYDEIKIYKGMLLVGLLLMAIIVYRLNLGVVSYVLMALYTMSYEIMRSLGNSIVAKKYKGEQGKILGVAGAAGFLGIAIGSLFSGYLLSANVYLPFIVNIFVMGLVFLLIKRNRQII